MGILISTFDLFTDAKQSWEIGRVDSKGIKNSISFSKDGYFSLHVKNLDMVGKKKLIQKDRLKESFLY
jgi:hypothetical protein